jgi:hypothetical protein
MSKPDDFDKFLKSGFEKSKSHIADEGFTEKVMSRLPTTRIFTINRNFILFLSAILSVFIFFISSGYKAVFISVTEIFNNGFHMVRSSLISLLVISVFISVSFIISRIEHDDNLI